MLRMPYLVFCSVLDQLYLLPLGENETIHDRCLTIENCLIANGWTWDLIIEELINEVPELQKAN